MTTHVLVTDMNILKVSAFANNPEKVAALKQKLALGLPLNEEELAIKEYVETFKVKFVKLWGEINVKLTAIVKNMVSALAGYFNHADYSRAASVLTPRQYHLMLNGKPKVRNKWWNEAKRRLAKHGQCEQGVV